MTEDRAVSLNAVLNIICMTKHFYEDSVSYNYVIKLLGELPSVGNDTNVSTTDYISRQAVIDIIKTSATISGMVSHINELPSVSQDIPKHYDSHDLIHRETARRIIDSPRTKEQMLAVLASAENQAKTGHWIKDEFGSRCERCGLYAYRDKFDKPWESPYCPNCGSYNGGD